jgi:hypothetical protein
VIIRGEVATRQVPRRFFVSDHIAVGPDAAPKFAHDDFCLLGRPPPSYAYVGLCLGREVDLPRAEGLRGLQSQQGVDWNTVRRDRPIPKIVLRLLVRVVVLLEDLREKGLAPKVRDLGLPQQLNSVLKKAINATGQVLRVQHFTVKNPRRYAETEDDRSWTSSWDDGIS